MAMGLDSAGAEVVEPASGGCEALAAGGLGTVYMAERYQIRVKGPLKRAPALVKPAPEGARDKFLAATVDCHSQVGSNWLWKYVADAQIAHAEMSILGRAGGNEPRSAGQVRVLRDQQDGAVLRVPPEGLGPIDRTLLNGAVLQLCIDLAHSAEPDARFARA